jgi:hypothetical protein
MSEWKGFSKETRDCYGDVLHWFQKVTDFETKNYMPTEDEDGNTVYDDNFKHYLIVRNKLIDQIRSLAERSPKTNISKTLQFIYELNQEYYHNCGHITKCNQEAQKKFQTEKKET